MKLLKFLPLLLILFFCSQIAFAQGGYGDLLYQEVEVENPVYMPVIGLGAGVINYYGELKTDYSNIIQGNSSFRFNAYQYIDRKHLWKVNINATLFGSISGYERSYDDTSMNANFETEFFAAGMNFEYSFGNIYKGKRKIVPFISFGVEYLMNLSSKTDIESESGERYQYYPDGTIRVGDVLVSRDYTYETNISDWNPYENPDFKTSALALVADAGFDLKISDRVALRLASSLHYTFTDDIDGISNTNTVDRIGDSRNDMFSFTYVALNLDLFSSAKTKTEELYFLDVTGDFDYTLIADDDRDGVLNLVDDCLETASGIPVDSIGCPFDDDNDGVPNYIDKEQFSNKGALVDEFGAELSANKIRESLYQDLAAVNRSEVYMVPVGMGWSKYTDMTDLYIPEKFKKLDIDGDSYISFDELLEAISGFFDFESEFTTEDIYELNNFFFAQ
jgi:hypothetical protein